MDTDRDYRSAAEIALARHAANHHGVFRGVHAAMAGLSPKQIVDRVSDGRWVAVHRDVYRMAGAPGTWRGDLLAATWAGGFRAVASHRSAAVLHRLPGRRPLPLEIMCPRGRRARHPGLLVHETKTLDPVDVVSIDGIALTSVARTLFDLGGVCRAGLVELALENALRRGLVTEALLSQTVRRLSRPGRAGGPVLRALLDERAPDRRVTGSEMETLLLQAIRAHGLPEPRRQYEVWLGSHRVGRVDAAYVEARIAIEYDSDEFHTGRRATRRDRARRHDLIAASWLPIDVGPVDLRSGGATACAAIAQALRDRRAPPLAS